MAGSRAKFAGWENVRDVLTILGVYQDGISPKPGDVAIANEVSLPELFTPSDADYKMAHHCLNSA
jgi:hypothetical protein